MDIAHRAFVVGLLEKHSEAHRSRSQVIDGAVNEILGVEEKRVLVMEKLDAELGAFCVPSPPPPPKKHARCISP